MKYSSEKWSKTRILELLMENNLMVERSLLILYSRQTLAERAEETTAENNGMGFNGCDAKLLTSFAKQIKTNKYGYAEGARLSRKQLTWARKNCVSM